jgi:hypothetical protein
LVTGWAQVSEQVSIQEEKHTSIGAGYECVDAKLVRLKGISLRRLRQGFRKEKGGKQE